jgi:thiol-disulfide isomerase/thioredoxin
LKEKELSALKAYVKGKAADRETAFAKAIEIGGSLERFQDVADIGSKYLTEYGTSPKAPRMKLEVASALARIEGKADQARKLFTELADATKADMQLHFDTLMALASAETDLGNIDAAKAAYDRIAEDLKSEQGIGQFIDSQKESLSQIGKDPTPFEVKDTAGHPLSLEKYKGKVVLLDFWATWCGPCVQELPHVIATYEKHHVKGFEIIGISLDKDEAKFKEFVAERGMTWPQYFDGKAWENEVAKLYQVQSIPATYLIDRNGKIYRTGLRGSDLERAVKKLLSAPGGDPKKQGSEQPSKP